MAEEVVTTSIMYILKKTMVKFIIRSKCVNLTFYMLYTSTMSLRAFNGATCEESEDIVGIRILPSKDHAN